MPKEQSEEVAKGLKLLAKSSMVVFIGLFLSKILTYVYRIAVARYFGPEVYGIFSLAIMVLGWFVAISSLGLAEGLLRYIPLYRSKKQPGKIKYIIESSFLITFFSGLLSGVILFFISDWLAVSVFKNLSLIPFLKVFSFLIPIWLFANLLLSLIRAFEKIAVYSFLLNILQNLLRIILLLLFVFIGFNYSSIIFSFFGSILLVMIISYLYSFRLSSYFLKREHHRFKIESKVFSEFFAYSWPLMFYGAIINLLHWIDSFTIGYFQTALEVGIYNAAVPIALFLMLAPEMFMQLFFPFITRYNAKKEFDVSRELSKQVGKWIFIINLPSFLLILIFPGSFLNLLFGSEYILAKTSLQILASGFFIFSLFKVSTNILSSLGKSKTLLIDIITVSVVNLFLNIILVPRYGINGAALSTSFSFVLFGILATVQCYSVSSIIPLRRKMFRVFVSGAISLIIILFVRSYLTINLFSIILILITFYLIYILCLFLTKSLDKNDIAVLQKTFKKIRQFFKRLN